MHIVESVVGLAGKLGIDTVAEGGILNDRLTIYRGLERIIYKGITLVKQ